MDTLTKVIQIFGTQKNLANKLDVTPMAVSQWKKRGVPLGIAKAIEEVTNGQVTKHELRPDFFEPTEAKKVI